jgi:hypothetical protein
MAARDRRRTGGTGARAAGARGDTGLRLVRCRLVAIVRASPQHEDEQCIVLDAVHDAVLVAEPH